MLTKGDDYPVHQTPEPIAFAGTDRNFYDRYFFNGYSKDGKLFFAAAMGFYPQLGIADAAFCLSINGQQHNIRASRHMAGERMDLSAGPIRLEIIEPLRQLRVIVSPNDSDITADLTFTARHSPIQEPRFTRRNGTRLFMDYTRMTQNGAWSGHIKASGTQIDVSPENIMGTRDRSWGIRPVGAPDPQPPPGGNLAQFFWLWSPCNFAQHAVFAHSNDDASGLPWNRRAVIVAIEGDQTESETPEFQYSYHTGTRRMKTAHIDIGNGATLTLKPTGFHFYMSGLGYTHPVWGHGMDHGALAATYDVIDLASITDNAPENLHVQALCEAVLTIDGRDHQGCGVLEQLLIGPHAPSGFNGLLDPAT
jgi:hypothetical protein